MRYMIPYLIKLQSREETWMGFISGKKLDELLSANEGKKALKKKTTLLCIKTYLHKRST